MIKKILMVTGAITLGVLFLNKDTRAKAKEAGTDVVAFVKSVVKKPANANSASAPGSPEKKLAALRGRVKELDGEVSAAKDRLAQQIVDQSRGTVDLSKLREDVDTGTKLLSARAKDIDAARTELVGYGGQTIPVSDARKRLDRDLDLIAAKKGLLAEMEKSARQLDDAVTVTRQHVAELETLKLEAITKLDKLDLELKTLRLQEVKDRHDTNESKSGQFLEALKELEKDIEVRKVRRSLDPEKIAPTSTVTLEKTSETASDAVSRKLGLKLADKKIEKSGD